MTSAKLDDEGKTTERAKLWRDDDHYPEVCRAILGDVYSKELLDAVPDPTENRSAAERWFARQGVGESAAQRMAALYSVLVEADASKQPEQHKKASAKKATKSVQPQVKQTEKEKEKEQKPAVNLAANPTSSNALPAPGVHINLEIHISADATADQIDQIFSAMAKHIYRRA
jgi:hypothetical protein